MKFGQASAGVPAASRPPHGGRGLKLVRAINSSTVISRRPPHGGRGLKLRCVGDILNPDGRPPHGGRGLKCRLACCPLLCTRSPSSRRAWIEILWIQNRIPRAFRSPSSRRAWIKIVIVALTVIGTLFASLINIKTA